MSTVAIIVYSLAFAFAFFCAGYMFWATVIDTTDFDLFIYKIRDYIRSLKK